MIEKKKKNNYMLKHQEQWLNNYKEALVAMQLRDSFPTIKKDHDVYRFSWILTLFIGFEL